MKDQTACGAASLGQGGVVDQVVGAVVPRRRPVIAERAVPLPVAELGSVLREAELAYRIASVDGRGRVSDRVTVERLGWMPGVRLTIDAGKNCSVIVNPHAQGAQMVTSQGYIRIPARIRKQIGIDSGGRVLIVAAVERDFLMVHPLVVLDEMLVRFHLGWLDHG
ncbi:AbrB/MazE/SpoVT family DNA-binding domain-containing protein [Saccharopolyspora cebuensis]|uniref:AbrB/MazE/SpoVT family DNA-binding domain-containing protein n=1 Tax=Saccharopolyspora cebuensis TaxID=418759 RepID=A0ABV4CS31_9PSEU